MNSKAAVLLLICVTLLAYANSLNNSFIWDDSLAVKENDFIKSWKNFPRLFDKSYLTGLPDIRYLGKRDIGSGELLYRPISTLSYFIDFSLWKLNPFGFHLTNLFLHIVNAVLFFSLAILLSKNVSIALAASLLFAAHPVNSETVNVIAFRPNLLSFLFFIAAFILFIRSSYYANKKWLFIYALSLGSFCLALFSKEAAIILPLILLSYDYFFKKIPGGIYTRFKRYYLGYFSVLFFYLLVKFVLIGNVLKQVVASPMADFFTNIFTMFKVFATYIQWCLLPVNLHPTLPEDSNFIAYSLWEMPVLLSVVLLTVILFSIIKLGRKFPLFSFALSWFFLALIPVANILYPLTNYMAARYLYLPSAGFCLAAAFLLIGLENFKIFKIPKAALKKISRDALAVIIIIYIMFTLIRNFSFRNDIVFWKEMTQNYPANALAHSNLGSCFKEKGFLGQAMNEYKNALSLDPGYAQDHYALGVCFYEKSMLSSAVGEFMEALRLNPNFVSAYISLGRALSDQGLNQEAIECFAKAIQLENGCLDAYNGMGTVYARMKKFDLAKKFWVEALQIDTGNKDAQENLRKLKRLGY